MFSGFLSTFQQVKKQKFIYGIIFGLILILVKYKSDYGFQNSDNNQILSVLNSCGEICDESSQNIKSIRERNVTYRHVKISTERCQALFKSHFMFQSSNLRQAPKRVPDNLQQYFTMNNQIELKSLYFNNVYLGNSRRNLKWTKQMISNDIEKIKNGTLFGTYGYDRTNDLFKLLKFVDINEARVLVIGSEKPWVEAAALAAGAKEIVTLEFSSIVSTDSRISAYTPSKFKDAYLSNRLEPFDVVITYSSVEHSGLARYGDALNPWSDVITIAMAWCVAREKAKLIIEVPRAESDVLYFNAHRVYGPIRFPFLTTNWVNYIDEDSWLSSQPKFGIIARPVALSKIE